MLVRALLARHGSDSVLAKAIGSDFKGNVSLACYVLGILLSVLANRWLGLALYVGVALDLAGARPAHRARAGRARGASAPRVNPGNPPAAPRVVYWRR